MVWNPARWVPSQHISKFLFFLNIFIKGDLAPKKWLCKILYMVLRVGKFNIDNFWSLERFISSILSLVILILLIKVLHPVLLYGSFSKQLIWPNLLIEVFKRPLPHGKYIVFKIFHPCFSENRPIVWKFWCFSVNFVRIVTIISYFWSMQSVRSFFCHVSTHYGSTIRNYSENSDKINWKTQKFSHYGPIFWKTRMKYFKNYIFTMWEGSLKNLYQQIGSYQLFRKRSIQEHCVLHLKRFDFRLKRKNKVPKRCKIIEVCALILIISNFHTVSF